MLINYSLTEGLKWIAKVRGGGGYGLLDINQKSADDVWYSFIVDGHIGETNLAFHINSPILIRVLTGDKQI